MDTIRNDKIICCDVDDTLVFAFINGGFEADDPNLIDIRFHNFLRSFMPHFKHIELLKKYKADGYFVIVWSQAGFEWAETVVKALNLEDHVDLAMTKPFKYIDDLPANAFMDRLYLTREGIVEAPGFNRNP